MGAMPLWFKCPQQRKEDGDRSFFARRGRYGVVPKKVHTIKRTGRSKPNQSTRRGGRALDRSHEWNCSCGRKGWSTNPGVLQKPIGEEYL